MQTTEQALRARIEQLEAENYRLKRQHELAASHNCARLPGHQCCRCVAEFRKYALVALGRHTEIVEIDAELPEIAKWAIAAAEALKEQRAGRMNTTAPSNLIPKYCEHED